MLTTNQNETKVTSMKQLTHIQPPSRDVECGLQATLRCNTNSRCQVSQGEEVGLGHTQLDRKRDNGAISLQ